VPQLPMRGVRAGAVRELPRARERVEEVVVIDADDQIYDHEYNNEDEDADEDENVQILEEVPAELQKRAFHNVSVRRLKRERDVESDSEISARQRRKIEVDEQSRDLQAV
jgi:hypothetical protein